MAVFLVDSDYYKPLRIRSFIFLHFVFYDKILINTGRLSLVYRSSDLTSSHVQFMSISAYIPPTTQWSTPFEHHGMYTPVSSYPNITKAHLCLTWSVGLAHPFPILYTILVFYDHHHAQHTCCYKPH